MGSSGYYIWADPQTGQRAAVAPEFAPTVLVSDLVTSKAVAAEIGCSRRVEVGAARHRLTSPPDAVQARPWPRP